MVALPALPANLPVHHTHCAPILLGTALALLCTRSGGIQGGISNGEHIVIRVAFKPTATIAQRQATVSREVGSKGHSTAGGGAVPHRHPPQTVEHSKYDCWAAACGGTMVQHSAKLLPVCSSAPPVQGKDIELLARGRHDPCVVPRAVPMVEAMVALVLADQLLQHYAQVGDGCPLCHPMGQPAHGDRLQPAACSRRHPDTSRHPTCCILRLPPALTFLAV